MLDDQGIFVAEDVKSDAWSEEVVLRVSEDIVPIFKDADRIDGRIGRQILDERGDTCRTGSHVQVVLDILIGIDICERNRIFGLKRLQEIDDLLFTARGHGVLQGQAPFSTIVDHLVRYVQVPQRGPIMLQWDDENCSPARRSSIKQFRSSGSMASLRRAFRTLNVPQVCASLACIRNSRTKKTCSWRACAGISTS